MELTGAEALVATLERADVEVVFGLCGHANLPILDALSGSRIRFVPVRHEQVAAHMADAYFRFSHKPGVVLTTIGPGLANAVTGVWEAALDSSAVIVIAGNVPSYMAGREAFQELSAYSESAQAEVYRPFVKRAYQVRSGTAITQVAQRAFNLATNSRPGPVLIDFPLDFQTEPHDYVIPDVRRHGPTSKRVAGPASEIDKALELLVAAERPLIHAGNGATLSQASAELAEFAELLNVPVTTSMQAQGVIDSAHPLSGGYPGVVGTPTGNALTNAADVVLALGTRFSELETSSWDAEYCFQFENGNAKLIQVDIDPHELGRVYPLTVGIVGDIRTVLRQLLSRAKELQIARRSTLSAQHLRDLRASWDVERRNGLETKSPQIRVEQVIDELYRKTADDCIILADAGTFRHGVGQYFPLRRAQSWFIPSGFGTMGGSASACLGAKLARPSAQVINLIGDGGFSAGLASLATAVEQDLPVVWVILNNSSWDSIETYQHIAYDGRVYGTRLEDRAHHPWNPDFVKLAEAYGIAAASVTNIDELPQAVGLALDSPGPYLLEVVVSPTKLNASGHWDVGDVLKREGDFKRKRGASYAAERGEAVAAQ